MRVPLQSLIAYFWEWKRVPNYINVYKKRHDRLWFIWWLDIWPFEMEKNNSWVDPKWLIVVVDYGILRYSIIYSVVAFLLIIFCTIYYVHLWVFVSSFFFPLYSHSFRLNPFKRWTFFFIFWKLRMEGWLHLSSSVLTSIVLYFRPFYLWRISSYTFNANLFYTR